ncbi:acyl transferase/acyl hydrolase/lysophospholipase [Flagelloscypha sp. PMI_526]|nr:acyl transferase/acyl hydrolase/lysophospholipase [Flagelloscypha sp. PMI_526]
MTAVVSLSLDGGGFQSLSQLFILVEIMQRLQWMLKLETCPLPCEHFDIMGGSGSGGIIALLLGRFRMQVEVAIECFIQIYQTISSNGLDKASRSKSLEDTIKSLVQEHLPDETPGTKLGQIDPKCKTFVCAMPSNAPTGPKPVRLFRNFRPRKHASFDCTIWEAARATTAHPRLFIPIIIGPTWAKETFIDPGLRYNNPIELVIEETNSVYLQPTTKFYFISFGAGHPGITGAPVNEDDWFSAIQEIANDCEGIADQVARRYQTGYFRLNVSQGLQGSASESLLDPGKIASHTQQYLQDSSIDNRVDAIVELLVRRHREIACSSYFIHDND